jgi:hypothetical protein
LAILGTKYCSLKTKPDHNIDFQEKTPFLVRIVENSDHNIDVKENRHFSAKNGTNIQKYYSDYNTDPRPCSQNVFLLFINFHSTPL